MEQSKLIKKVLIIIVVLGVILIVRDITGKKKNPYDGTYYSDAYGGNHSMVIEGDKCTITTYFSGSFEGGKKSHVGKIKIDGKEVTLHMQGEDVPGVYDNVNKIITLRDEIIFVKEEK